MAAKKSQNEMEDREKALQEIIDEVKKKYEENNHTPISVELIGKVFKISSYADIQKLEFELRHFLKIG
jgi:hypothetical protein